METDVTLSRYTSDVSIAYLCSVNMYTKLVQVLHFEILLTSCIEN